MVKRHPMIKKPVKSLTNTLTAVTKTKLHEQIVIQIPALIDKGRLKHGDQLPPERELATIFTVSRHSVREAIRVLEQKNILKSRPGSGTYINLEDESSVVEFLDRAIDREKHTMAEIFQFRDRKGIDDRPSQGNPGTGHPVSPPRTGLDEARDDNGEEYWSENYCRRGMPRRCRRPEQRSFGSPGRCFNPPLFHRRRHIRSGSAFSHRILQARCSQQFLGRV